VAGCCEHGNEHSGSIKCGGFLDCLRKVYFLKNDSSPWNKFVSYLFNYTTDHFSVSSLNDCFLGGRYGIC
jgi:hypothetical protein